MQKAWWKEGTVYQIYPRSFLDSNADGIGDLKGIIQKLDYLQLLGVNIIWLSPVYKSPYYDNGYDISDYYKIMDGFGTMEDWEELLNEVHQRGMKLIMDLVINHTSDEHPWFVASRSSLDNPYRNYYIWRKGQDNGREPNNWASEFGGSAWEYDPMTGEYYLHLFSDRQPDLNWENKALRHDVYDMMTWWLKKGIDGFRMDVINLISKAEGLPDASGSKEGPYQWGRDYYRNGPRLHYFLREMYAKVLSKFDIMTVGETPGVNCEKAELLVGEDRHELSMVFLFELLELDYGDGDKWKIVPWKLCDFKRIISDWQDFLEGIGWNSLFLNNHDQPRAVSRFGNDDTFRVRSAKMLATMLHTLQGTPYIYQGEEIGMTNVKFPDISYYRDIDTLNFYKEAIASGMKIEQVMDIIHERSRDNARTPMQWNNSEHAGFTAGKPWINLNPNYPEVNVEDNLANPDSVFHYYRQLIKLRKEKAVLIYGDYRLLCPNDEHLYVYLRIPKLRRVPGCGKKKLAEIQKAEKDIFENNSEEKILVILNFSAEVKCLNLSEDIRYQESQLLISNYSSTNFALEIEVRPFEASVFSLS
ncbi:alpha-glucosidase [Desulfosporosinus sp. OT]|uniref:alpha-glucosidase n=1 Tax=Desulfosporosinus sp. OT TaxID=913865 RepID=UPI000223A976|nr:alpha-glucosidase [Desulfosporosinus sp. OT]EGW37694.1 oligo-1,6-glucosidase [Desulfosporosinus sp. OT]